MLQDSQRVWIGVNPWGFTKFSFRNAKKPNRSNLPCEIPDSCGFHGWKRFPIENSCSEHPHEAFKPWIFGFWVGLHDLGLGFTMWENGARAREEERETFSRNEQTGLLTLFIHVLGRVDPRPGPLSSPSQPLIKILMDLDQSNAPGALVWSGSIRSVGMGWVFLWFFAFFHFFLISLLFAPLFLLLEPVRLLIFLQKILKKITMCFLIYFHCLAVFSYFEVDKKHAR